MRASFRGAVALAVAVLVVTLLPALPVIPAESAPAEIVSHEVEASVDGQQVVELPIEASHVSLVWPDEHDDEADDEADLDDEDWQPDMWIAFSRDGLTFGPDQEVIHDDAAEQEAGVTHSGVMWTGGAR